MSCVLQHVLLSKELASYESTGRTDAGKKSAIGRRLKAMEHGTGPRTRHRTLDMPGPSVMPHGPRALAPTSPQAMTQAIFGPGSEAYGPWGRMAQRHVPCPMACPLSFGMSSVLCPMALSYVLWPCPMSYGPVLCPVARIVAPVPELSKNCASVSWLCQNSQGVV